MSSYRTLLPASAPVRVGAEPDPDFNVLKIHLGYYSPNSDSSNSATADQPDLNYEALKKTIKTSLGKSQRDWTVKVCIRQLMFFGEIPRAECDEDAIADHTQPAIVAFTMKYNSICTPHFTRTDIIGKLREYFHQLSVTVYDVHSIDYKELKP